MIDRASWKIIELVIRRYPDSKRKYEEYISDIMASSSSDRVITNTQKEYIKPQSVTEAKALKMTSAYAERLKKEIEAVEMVYNDLCFEEQKVIQMRYWTDIKRNIPYLDMAKNIKYSERQMRRIAYKVIVKVGKYLGEIS